MGNLRFRKCDAVLLKPAMVAAIIIFASSAAVSVRAQTIPGALPDSTAALARGEWPAYAGTYAAARYAPLAQIDRTNAKDLRVVWRWRFCPTRVLSSSESGARSAPNTGSPGGSVPSSQPQDSRTISRVGTTVRDVVPRPLIRSSSVTTDW